MTPALAETLVRPQPIGLIDAKPVSRAISEAAAHPPKPLEARASALFCFTCLMALIVLTSFTKNAFLNPVFEAFEHHRWLRTLEKPSILWMVMVSLMLYLKTFFWFRYKPSPVCGMDDAPSMSVIIPAYNEGPLVLRTIESVVKARYPREKLEIFVVDDGSRDDTWRWVKTAAERFPELVTPAHFEKNRGKRAALAYAFRKARGDVFVTIDSDSLIDKEALLAMAGAFKDPKVGAVAGKLLALNRDEKTIPKMLNVYYLFTSDLLRAFQSAYRTVACCPGALAAYRGSIIRKITDEWESQTFFGRHCKNGEDRAITNMVFREGYDAVYQRAAAVYTMVPTTYQGVCRMYLRWDRGTIREEFNFAKLVWKRPLDIRFTALFFFLMRNLCYPIGYGALFFMAYLASSSPIVLLHFVMGITLMALFDMLFYLNSDMSWNFLYGILYSYFSIFALFWIYPYAFVTVRTNSWMTR